MDGSLWFLFGFGVAVVPTVAYCIWRDRGRDTSAGVLTVEDPPSDVVRATLHNVAPSRHTRLRPS